MVPAMLGRPFLTKPLARCASVAAFALLWAPAWATPESQGASPRLYSDAVGNYLAEKGLLQAGRPAAPADADPAERGLIDQVRDQASNMVMSSMNFLGVPYRRGGTSADKGFDCSGFTRYVFEHSLGLVLPRRADEQ